MRYEEKWWKGYGKDFLQGSINRSLENWRARLVAALCLPCCPAGECYQTLYIYSPYSILHGVAVVWRSRYSLSLHATVGHTLSRSLLVWKFPSLLYKYVVHICPFGRHKEVLQKTVFSSWLLFCGVLLLVIAIAHWQLHQMLQHSL